MIKASDLNRSLKSELQVRPIQPPSAIQAKHILFVRFSKYGNSKKLDRINSLAFLLHWSPKKQVLKWFSNTYVCLLWLYFVDSQCKLGSLEWFLAKTGFQSGLKILEWFNIPFPQSTAVVSSAAGSIEISAALRILKISNRSLRHDREVSSENGCSMWIS